MSVPGLSLTSCVLSGPVRGLRQCHSCDMPGVLDTFIYSFSVLFYLFVCLFIKDIIYLFETARESKHKQGAGAEGRAGSPLCRERDMGSIPES